MRRIAINNDTGVKGRYKIRTYKAGTQDLLRETDWIDNLVMNGTNTGVNLIAQRIAGITTYDIQITQAKIGDDNTVPLDSDTDLGNVVLSGIPLANQSVTGNIATLFFFIPDANLPNGTYEEFGIFCGAQIFARSLISPSYTKATSEDTTVEYEIEVNN